MLPLNIPARVCHPLLPAIYEISSARHRRGQFPLPGNFRTKPIDNGNFMVEVCTSRDGAFIAIQLHQFVRLSYEPVTDVHIFEGDEARVLKKIF